MDDFKNRIGLILSNVYGNWCMEIWPPFVRHALRMKQNLFIFPGGRLKGTVLSESDRNSIYSLANSENLDGLICWSVGVKFYDTKDEDFVKFHHGFDLLPYITMGYKVPGHPCFSFDNYTGMKRLVTHSIKIHGAEKIAFLQGPKFEDALDRLSGYRDALKDAGLPDPDESLLVTDSFGWEDGALAAAQLFEERKLVPGRDFDTLAGASDYYVVRAINYFTKHGYHVPRDYRVLGFDNSIESRFASSPLSTVMAPYSEISRKSLELMAELTANKGSGQTIENSILPTEPVIRESCGCSSIYCHFPDPQTPINFTVPDPGALTAKIIGYLKLENKDPAVFIDPLVRAWYDLPDDENAESAAKLNENGFFSRLEAILKIYFGSQGSPEPIFGLLKEIFYSGLVSVSHFRKYESSVLRLIFKVQDQAAINVQYEINNRNIILNSLKMELMMIRDQKSLMDILSRYLPELGIETAGCVLYENEETSLWLGGFSADGPFMVTGQSFPVQQLVPKSLKSFFSCGIFMVQPLTAEDKALGYFIHTVSHCYGIFYEELRTAVSFAFRRIFQLEEAARTNQKMLESHKKNYELLLQKEAAQAASDAKSRFLANVSHEIRTPMNAILGMSELLLSKDLNRHEKQYVEDIKTSSLALLDIINDILDLSKIQSGKMDLHLRHYDFRALLDNISSMMQFLAKDKDIVFRADTEGNVPKCLYGDNIRLRQILLNILSNAVKFTVSGHVNLFLRITNENLLFTIEDTGRGIREENIPNIFESFRRFDEAKTPEIKGTGLGLTITKALVEMMGGYISVKSVYGAGTTFFLGIPKVLGDETQIPRTVSEEKITYSKDTKILVVDDNIVNLKVISGLLELYNLSVYTASSGQEAIIKIHQNQFDLIFMDHMMPGMDGIEVLKSIRKTGVNVPVIALTANAVASAKEMLLTAGMDDFLSKPILKDELSRILDKWISSSRVEAEMKEKPESGSSGGDNMAITGINEKNGLARNGGSVKNYYEILEVFYQDGTEKIQEIKTSLEKNDIKLYLIYVHALKSACANIGADDLSRFAESLENAGKEENMDFVNAQTPVFLSDLQTTLDSINTNVIQDIGNGEPDPALIKEELFKLKDALAAFDSVEIKNSVNKLQVYRKTEAGSYLEKILNNVLIGEYDEAILTIKEALDF